MNDKIYKLAVMSFITFFVMILATINTYPNYNDTIADSIEKINFDLTPILLQEIKIYDYI